MMDSVRDHFGIGFRVETVAQLNETGSQRLMILDNAVVHDGNSAPRNVRMRIARGGNAVSGPTGMGDADMAGDWCGIKGILQRFYFAHGAHPSELTGGPQHGHSGGIVSPVLETAQSLHQDRNGIALRDDTDDSAHVEMLRASKVKGGLVCPSAMVNPPSYPIEQAARPTGNIHCPALF